MPTTRPRVRDDGNYVVNGVLQPVDTKTASYTALLTDRLILMDASGGARTVTLPAAASCVENGREKDYIIVKIDNSANAVTIDPNASETINGAATLVLSKQFAAVHIHTDGSNWFTEQGNIPQAAEAALTFGTNVTAATANGSLEDSAATNPSDTNFNNNMKELGTKINNLITKLTNAGILAP